MKIKVIIGFVVTAVAFAVLFSKVDLEMFENSFTGIDYLLIVPAVIVYFSTFFIRGLRWKLLVTGFAGISFKSSLGMIVSGYALNNVFPARAGDITRAYATSKDGNCSKTSSLAAIFAEKVFDGFSIVTILFSLLLFFPSPPIIKSISVVAGLCFFILFFFIVTATFSDIPFRFLDLLESIAPDFMNPVFVLGRKFFTGVSSLDGIPAVLRVFILSFAVWFLEAIVYFMAIEASGHSLPFDAVLYALVAVNLAMLIPSTPGGLGVFQFAVVSTLGFFGMESNSALAISFVIHAIQLIPVTIIGFIWLNLNHLKLGDLKNS